MNYGVDDLVMSFMKEARKAGFAVLVAYGLTEDGKPVLRIASNVEEARAQGLWNWLTRVDERGLDAGAKALAFAERGSRPLEALREEDPQPQEADAYWAWIHEALRQEYRVKIKLVLDAAKSQQGRTLNIIHTDDKPQAS
jgi:hypothetical protein